ncbi:hypothetical protein PMI08_03149 [Brevibacillus sp. CF112]|uniref:hypothetical protein n=1 Tax=Brevibacillus sp. CF112 TaxID=1144311 RepID=UPI000271880D|nr:hypothetical protein [Brevibacillus sp. CF112]EJL42498.1 hypothetical protein PMI08_03149 [Brevibacillus sp. CF112]
MLDGYHHSFASHAGKQFARSLYIPNVALGIGDAEVKGAVPVQFTIQPKKAVVPIVPPLEQDWSKAAIDGQKQSVDDDMFPQGGYMGDWLAGV